MPAMENSGGRTAAFAGAKQLLLQCGLLQQWRPMGAKQLFLQCGLYSIIICKFHLSGDPDK